MTFWDFLSKTLQSETVKNLFCTLAGALFALFLQSMSHLWNNRGKLKIYYQNYENNIYKRTACFYNNLLNGKAICFLPLAIDIVNTSGKNKVVRHLLAHAMLKDKHVATFIPCQSASPKSSILDVQEESYGTTFSYYTYMIPAHNCVYSELLYILYIDLRDIEKYRFDHIDLVWHDEKDKKHRSTIAAIENCWNIGDINISNEPQLIEIR